MNALKQFLTGDVNRRGWALMLLVLVFASLLAWSNKHLIDFQVFYRAAERFWEGALLYQVGDGDMPFKYTPIVALFLSPIALLPYQTATMIWLIATAVVLLRFIAWAREEWFPAAPVWSTVLVLVFIAPFHRHLIALGQCDIFILALVMWSERLRKTRPVASGAVLALACAFKPPFLLFVALAVVMRDWRRIGGVGVGVAGAVVLPMLRYGPGGMIEQLTAWQSTLGRTTAPMFTHPDNQSVFGIVALHLVSPDSPAFRPVALALCALLFTLVVGPSIRVKDDEERRSFLLAAAFYLTASLSPLGWRTNLVAMVPMFFLMFRLLHTSTHPLRWVSFVPPALNAFVGLLVFDIFGRKVFRALIDARTFGILAAVSALGIAWAFTARVGRSTSSSASPEGSSAPGGPSPRPELR